MTVGDFAAFIGRYSSSLGCYSRTTAASVLAIQQLFIARLPTILDAAIQQPSNAHPHAYTREPYGCHLPKGSRGHAALVKEQTAPGPLQSPLAPDPTAPPPAPCAPHPPRCSPTARTRLRPASPNGHQPAAGPQREGCAVSTGRQPP